MTSATQSYRKVFYDLRPAKQVERRMMIDVLHMLAERGLPLRDYQYTGMGSIYFVDFSLFHRLLGLTKFLSVEYSSTIERRVRFNRPFAQIEVLMASIGDAVARIDRDRKHIVWLDYDYRLETGIVRDVVLSAEVLPPGSLLFVTVDVEPPSHEGGPSQWRKYYEAQAGDYLPFDVDDDSFSRTRLGSTNSKIIMNAIRQGLVGRPSVEYLPLLSFLYADGHSMLTIGGIIGGETERSILAASGVASLPFVRMSSEDDPFEIEVPRLTRKERIYLDHHMPSEQGWVPTEFELSDEEIAQYRTIYRYYPIYGELLY